MGEHGRRARGLATLAATAVLVVGAAAACQLGTWMGEDGPAVAVIGDSLVYQAEGNLGTVTGQRLLADELVASGYRAHVSGVIGETTQLAHERLWPKVADDPNLDTLVIALGNNDVYEDIPLESSRATLRQWLVEAADVRCVALVGLNVAATEWRMDQFGPAFNQMLVEEAARHPQARYVEWAPDLDIHGLTGDVHLPTAEAAAQYRSTLLGAVDGCREPEPPSATTTTTTTEPESTTTTTEPESTTTTTEPESTTTTTTTEAESTTTTAVPDEGAGTTLARLGRAIAIRSAR